MESPRFSTVSRAVVEARAPAMFNLFSSACRRRPISPASADNEPDITNVLLQMKFRARETSAERSLFQVFLTSATANAGYY
jgi:hypothetical protein